MNMNNWEEVPQEDLWQDGELKKDEVFDSINYHLFVEGDWKIMRRKECYACATQRHACDCDQEGDK